VDVHAANAECPRHGPFAEGVHEEHAPRPRGQDGATGPVGGPRAGDEATEKRLPLDRAPGALGGEDGDRSLAAVPQNEFIDEERQPVHADDVPRAGRLHDEPDILRPAGGARAGPEEEDAGDPEDASPETATARHLNA
jgi:hypothetical protein